MNVAFFLVPKAEVAYVYEKDLLPQALERMKTSGYTAIPVLTEDNLYVGSVSEGDFLWHFLQKPGLPPLPEGDRTCVRDIMRPDRNPPVQITAGIPELLRRAEGQNFIPVVDDRNVFIGIVRRSEIIHYYTADPKE